MLCHDEGKGNTAQQGAHPDGQLGLGLGGGEGDALLGVPVVVGADAHDLRVRLPRQDERHACVIALFPLFFILRIEQHTLSIAQGDTKCKSKLNSCPRFSRKATFFNYHPYLSFK